METKTVQKTVKCGAFQVVRNKIESGKINHLNKILTMIFKIKDYDGYQSFYLYLRPIPKMTTSSPIEIGIV